MPPPPPRGPPPKNVTMKKGTPPPSGPPPKNVSKKDPSPPGKASAPKSKSSAPPAPKGKPPLPRGSPPPKSKSSAPPAPKGKPLVPPGKASAPKSKSSAPPAPKGKPPLRKGATSPSKKKGSPPAPSLAIRNHIRTLSGSPSKSTPPKPAAPSGKPPVPKSAPPSKPKTTPAPSTKSPSAPPSSSVGPRPPSKKKSIKPTKPSKSLPPSSAPSSAPPPPSSVPPPIPKPSAPTHPSKSKSKTKTPLPPPGMSKPPPSNSNKNLPKPKQPTKAKKSIFNKLKSKLTNRKKPPSAPKSAAKRFSEQDHARQKSLSLEGPPGLKKNTKKGSPPPPSLPPPGFKKSTSSKPSLPPPKTNTKKRPSPPSMPPPGAKAKTSNSKPSTAPPPGLTATSLGQKLNERQTAASSTSTSPTSKSSNSKKKKSSKGPARGLFKVRLIINELIYTEENYVRDLNTLCKYYVEPLHPDKSEQVILSMEDHDMVFANSIEIRNLHQHFLDTTFLKLKDLVQENASMEDIQSATRQLATTFTNSFASKLTMYGKFVSTYPERLAKLKLLGGKSKTSKKWLQYCSEQKIKKECRKLSLSSFLIMPVQRCPRYLLMLQDILKHTTKDVNAPPTLRTDVQEALLAIEQTNGSIDNAASRAKATEMLQKIQNKFEKGLLIVKPGRRLLSEDTMTVTMLSDTGGAMGESQQASVFLFNDLIMIGCPNVKRGRSMSSLFSSKKRGHTRSGTKGKSGSVSDISLTEGTAGEDVSFTTFVPPMDLNDRSFAAKFNVALSCIMLSNTIRIQCAVADAVRSGESVAAKTESWYLKLLQCVNDIRSGWGDDVVYEDTPAVEAYRDGNASNSSDSDEESDNEGNTNMLTRLNQNKLDNLTKHKPGEIVEIQPPKQMPPKMNNRNASSTSPPVLSGLGPPPSSGPTSTNQLKQSKKQTLKNKKKSKHSKHLSLVLEDNESHSESNDESSESESNDDYQSKKKSKKKSKKESKRSKKKSKKSNKRSKKKSKKKSKHTTRLNVMHGRNDSIHQSFFNNKKTKKKSFSSRSSNASSTSFNSSSSSSSSSNGSSNGSSNEESDESDAESIAELNKVEDTDSDISYHSSDDDPDDSEEVQNLRKKVRALGKKREKLILNGPNKKEIEVTSFKNQKKVSLKDLQEARVNKIQNILELEQDKLHQLQELSAIREKAAIVGEMKELEENLEDLESKKEKMIQDLKDKKTILELKLNTLKKLNGEEIDSDVEDNGKETKNDAWHDNEDDNEDANQWDSKEDQWLRGEKTRRRRIQENEETKSNTKPIKKDMFGNVLKAMSTSPSSRARIPASQRGGTSTLGSSVDNSQVRGYYNAYGNNGVEKDEPETQLTLRQLARGQRTKPLSTRDTLAAPEPEREGGPRWAKTIKDDIVDLKLSSVNIEPMKQGNSRRMFNQIKHRAGGDPNTEGKWRVLKLGNGQRVTVNLVCGWCHNDNSVQEGKSKPHTRIRCDLCDRPLKQKGYYRAVGAKPPPGRLLV